MRVLDTQALRYKRLAYLVVRDAIGFYLGIPKFFESVDVDSAVQWQIKIRSEKFATQAGRRPTELELLKIQKSANKFVSDRIQFLNEDFVHAKSTLQSSIWVDYLGLPAGYLINYVDGLPENVKSDLAVVPNWTTRDHSLSRPYINDKFVYDQFSI